ncbi:MAG TPA: dicarboxylate/amino acid:cation symporter [Thermoanaerobaculia bacterium]|nr:dicarboxylate/amino acid:cation symporter [Thermoanaerobaculia bacterium]
MTNRLWYRKLHWQILFAMVLGVAAGSIGGEAFAEKVGWMGTLFLSLLRMIIIPLVVSSIISGVASLGTGGGLARLFGKTFGYYLLSSLLAVLAGLLFVNLIQPGKGADFTGLQAATLPEDLRTPSSVVELILDIVPQNVVSAMATGDMLAVIFFSILFGLTISTLPDESRLRLHGFFEAAFQAMMKLTGFILLIAPIGVFALMTRAIASFGLGAFKAMGLYMATVTVGLTVHLFLTLPILLLLLARIRPWIHFRNMLEPLALAFSTSSSAATLPVTLSTVEKRVGVSNRVSSFVLPMGATINMDGTALYECAGVLFIAQALGIELTITQQAVVVLTALLASIGAAAVPSAGLVIIFIVLESVGLRGPQVDLLVGFMLAVDRPLDMYRTAVNVYSDSCGAAIIARSEGEMTVDAEVRTYDASPAAGPTAPENFD